MKRFSWFDKNNEQLSNLQKLKKKSAKIQQNRNQQMK